MTTTKNERQMIVDWFESDFKDSISKTTKVERLDDGKVNYSFSVVNTADYDFSRFSFKVEILNKADGKSLGTAVIEAGNWRSGEKKNFQSRIAIPEDVTGISFVAYSESVSYDGEPAAERSVAQEITDVSREIGDFVSNVDAGNVFGELFSTGGMPGTVTKTTTTTTTASGRTTTKTSRTTTSSTGKTVEIKQTSGEIDAGARSPETRKSKTTTRTKSRTYTNASGTYADRKLQKKLQKKRLGKSGWTMTLLIAGILMGMACFGTDTAYALEQAIEYAVASGALLLSAMVLKLINNSKAKRIRYYEAMVNPKGNTVIFDIASKINRPVDKVADELQEMIVQGFWPEAFVDYEDGLIVMTENGEPIVPISDTVSANKKAKRKMARERGKVPSSIDDLITMTDDAEVKNKLRELEIIINKVNKKAEERPELADDVKEFTEKFYPELVRLTDEFNEKIANLEAESSIHDKPETEIRINEGSLAAQAKDIKTQLIKLIGTVIEASDNLLDKLYEDDIMDITTDIAAMKTTIASRGLLDSDFDIK